jgi:hypothetical protein
MIDILRTELSDDPLTRGYASMTDEEAAIDLNTTYRERNKTSMTGSEVLNAVDATNWAGLTDAQKQVVWDGCVYCGLGYDRRLGCRQKRVYQSGSGT